MKVKFLAILSLAAVAGLAGCKGGATNANTNTVVVNTANTNMTMSTPMSTPMASPDMATQKVVEDAMKKAGLNDVVVSATSADVTLRGTVAKGKLGEAVRLATEASKSKKINNQLTEK